MRVIYELCVKVCAELWRRKKGDMSLEGGGAQT